MKIKLTQDESVWSASAKLTAAVSIGLVAGLIVGLFGFWKAAPLLAWDVAALAYMAATWRRVLGFNADLAKRHALREDPSRVTADAVLIVASVASLAAVAAVLAGAGQSSGVGRVGAPLLSVVSVAVSWFLVHTIYALRYAEMYYSQPEGGVDFGETKKPVYADFAYLAFTLGMTFQVSDTALRTRRFRMVALKQSLLSYLFGTIIIATTINLIAGLAK